MPGWWSRIEKVLDLVTGVPERSAPQGDLQRPPADESRGLIGGFEAKMTGVLVSALREAFNRDAARLEAEREQAEHERRRAELALQLEIARQAADREAGRLRAVGGLAVIVWLASLLFVTVHPFSDVAPRVILGLAWACLTAAIGAVFVGYRRVREAAAQVPADLDGPVGAALGADKMGASLRADPVGAGLRARGTPPRLAASDAASWLAIGGLALAATSLLVAM